MAWRVTTKKIFVGKFMKLLVSSSQGCQKHFLSNSGKKKSDFCAGTAFNNNIDGRVLKNINVIRFFHSTPDLFMKRREPESNDMIKARKKLNYVKRVKTSGPPVEAPYVPPAPRMAKSSRDRSIDIFEGMTIVELAKRSDETVDYLQQIVMNIGEKVDSEFEPISIDIAELIAMEAGINVKRLHNDEGAVCQPRPPVVTVMGHVDHGKTSLLDALRQTSVAANEAGGITQHLGAFVVSMPLGASITFLDTPGHAAFSAMRARGAAVTDIVVLVVAADDGVMPQTLEAISHAKAANIPVVVAINKCDKPSADPQKVRNQLASEGLMLEEMGGDIQVVEVSAKERIGLDKLEEALLLQSELMDLKARVDGPAQAYVVEARLHQGRGPLATAIMKSGTLACGQHIVVGAQWGRIRAIRDMSRKVIDIAQPAMPVELEGLKGLPLAGDDVIVVDSEERAKMLSAGRKRKQEAYRLKNSSLGRMEMPDNSEERSIQVEMPIVLKADVQGTVQAVRDALNNLNSPQVFLNIIHVGVGPISQSDFDLAHASRACIVGFNIHKPADCIEKAAKSANIKICVHRVIYHLLEEIGNLVVDKAPGTFETKVAGEGEILDIFERKKRSRARDPDYKIAGCRVTDGHMTRSSTMRLLRSGEVVFEGSCMSLKREKHDVDAVGKGNECGIVIQDYNDLRIGDVIQCLELVNVKPKFVALESGAVCIQC